MEKEQIAQLLNKLKAGTATDAERAFLEAWYAQYKAEESMDYQLTDRLEDANQIWAALPHHESRVNTGKRLWPRIAVAAAVIGMAVCVYFFNSERGVLKQVQDDVVYKLDIAPGKNMATLSVNGRSMPLSDAKTGVIVNHDKVTYNDGTSLGSLSASGGEMPEGQRGGVKTIGLTTPLGGMYSTILSDGTKIWLNADSKLEVLPNFWNKAQRLVKLSGEAYFEVAKDAKRPFIVQSAGQNVTVLGTHFNISAYQGEGVRTTLLEGSVKVASLSAMGRDAEGREVLLKPNQQSLITGNANITVKQVDAAEAIAWKNGNFVFNDEDLESILRKVSRWYNVEIVYESKPAGVSLLGAVSRSKNISAVLNALEQTGKVHFKIEGRRVTVMQ